MKRKFLLIALSLLCILLCSCEQKQPRPERPTFEKITSSEPEYGEIETGTVAGDYVYRIIDARILIKYHIPTGTASFVCPDPFCNHNMGMDCPFKVAEHNLAAIGNILYYSVEVDEQWHLRSYDGDSMKTEELRTSNGVLNRLFSYNYYLYFSESKLVDGNLSDTVVYRWDTQSGKTETIDCGYPNARIDFIELGRIVWKQGDTLFSTNLDGDDEREYNQTYQHEWGKYVYRWVFDGTKFAALYRKDLTTNKEILLERDIAFFFFYGDKVLYFKKLQTPRIIDTETGKKMKDEYGGNVYIMNSDGTENRLLCHVDDFYYAGTSSARNNEWVCGDWVGFQSQNYYLDTYGQAHYSLADTLFVNVITGEYKLIKFNHYE